MPVRDVSNKLLGLPRKQNKGLKWRLQEVSTFPISMPAGCFATRKWGQILKAGDGKRENVVKGGSWGHEDGNMRISVGEISSAVDKMRAGNLIDSAEGVKSVNCRVGHQFPSKSLGTISLKFNRTQSYHTIPLNQRSTYELGCNLAKYCAKVAASKH